MERERRRAPGWRAEISQTWLLWRRLCNAGGGSGILLVLNEQKIIKKKKALSPWELVEVAGRAARA
jgi:hypothetical protein